MWAWRHAKLRLSDSFWPQTTAECWKINFGGPVRYGVSPSVESVEFPDFFLFRIHQVIQFWAKTAKMTRHLVFFVDI